MNGEDKSKLALPYIPKCIFRWWPVRNIYVIFREEMFTGIK